MKATRISSGSKKAAMSGIEANSVAGTGLRVSRAHDSLEREAECVANRVIAGGDSGLAWSLSKLPVGARLQRKCSCGFAGGVEGECEECKKKEKLQRRATGSSTASFIPPVVDDVLRSPGKPLDSATRGFMESRFGHDFGRVRVHADRTAARSAAAVNALAYTVGSEVVFGAGRYEPSSPEGRRLIAHELTHVVQQQGASARPGMVDDPAAEFEAERNAHALGTAGVPSVHHSSGRGALQRQKPGGGSGGGLDADDQKIVDTAQHEASSFHCNVGPILWGILHKRFPGDTRKIAGTGCEAALPGLRTEFATTDPKDPKLVRSVPMLYAGKAFVASTDAPRLGDRVTDVGQQIALIDDWRIASFRIEEKDLANPRVSGQLRSMSAAQLMDYRDKTKDSEVKRYAESLITFSTPVQAGSAVDPLSGNMVMKIGNVNVVIEPDVRGAAGVKGGDTGENLVLDPQNIPGYNYDAKGIVKDFPGYTPTATLKIVTRYEAGVKPEVTSGYGRGTTPQDVGNKATGLRFHEGSHGEDYLNFMRNNPLPVFMGKNGDTVKAFKAARKNYLDALSAWGKQIKKLSERQTDCVGKTIDEFHKGEAGYKPICS
jgi:hypothetical protein